MKKLGIILVVGLMAIAGCSHNPVSNEPDLVSAPPLGLFGLPDGAILESAKFHLYIYQPGDSNLAIHLVTSPWAEQEVTWNNFNDAYIKDTVTTILANEEGWTSVDMTSLVRDWLRGEKVNFGFLVESTYGSSGRAIFYSREEFPYAPYMDIHYALNGISFYEKVNVFADTYIWELRPDENLGSYSSIYCGWVNVHYDESMALFFFDIGIPTMPIICNQTD